MLERELPHVNEAEALAADPERLRAATDIALERLLDDPRGVTTTRRL